MSGPVPALSLAAAFVAWPLAANDDTVFKIIGFVLLGVFVLVVQVVKAVREAIRKQNEKARQRQGGPPPMPPRAPATAGPVRGGRGGDPRTGPPPLRRKTSGPQRPTPPWQDAPPATLSRSQRKKAERDRRAAQQAAAAEREVQQLAERQQAELRRSERQRTTAERTVSDRPTSGDGPGTRLDSSLAARLVRPQNLRAAVLLSEILKPPVALRDERGEGRA